MKGLTQPWRRAAAFLAAVLLCAAGAGCAPKYSDFDAFVKQSEQPITQTEYRLAPPDVIAALDRAARRGELPGFEPSGDAGFVVDVFGSPFDRALEGRVAPAGDGAEIAFRPRLLVKAPLVLLASVVLTLWPGIIFVDILVPASWWPTWTWYVPLVVLPTLLMAPGMWRKSETAAAAHAREQIGKIAVAAGGDVVDEPH